MFAEAIFARRYPGVSVCPDAWAGFREVSQSRRGHKSPPPDGSDMGLLEGECMSIRPVQQAVRRVSSRWDRRTAFVGQQPLSLNSCAHFTDFDRDTVYLVPAPLYHADGLAWSMNVLRAGGTVVVVNKFDSLETLRLIETYRVTHAQFVPTMFVRMLRLPEAERTRYDISSLKVVIHAAGTLSAGNQAGDDRMARPHRL